MRRHSHLLAAAVAASLVGIMSASAHASPQGALEASAPAATGGLSSKPFSRLFTDAAADARAAMPRFKLGTPNLAPRRAPHQICGTLVVPPNPAIDPKFEKRPADTRTNFMIRTVPLLCR